MMSKRQRFVISSALLSLGFVGLQFLEGSWRYSGIGGLALLTIILFAWSLKEGLSKNLTLLTLVLPAVFTLGVGLFWFLLPSSIIAKIPIVILYGLGIYALCLTANIYTVAAIRTIALLRSARGVGFVFTLLTAFLVFDTILSLKAQIWVNFILVVLLAFPLFLQGLWASTLEEHFSRDLLTSSLAFSLILGEMTVVLFFWPVTLVVGSLFLTVGLYMLLGLGQAKLEGRLYTQIIKEYLVIFLLVVLGMFIATRWGQ